MRFVRLSIYGQCILFTLTTHVHRVMLSLSATSSLAVALVGYRWRFQRKLYNATVPLLVPSNILLGLKVFRYIFIVIFLTVLMRINLSE